MVYIGALGVLYEVKSAISKVILKKMCKSSIYIPWIDLLPSGEQLHPVGSAVLDPSD